MAIVHWHPQWTMSSSYKWTRTCCLGLLTFCYSFLYFLSFFLLRLNLFVIGSVILCFCVLFGCCLVVIISTINCLKTRPKNDWLCVERDVKLYPLLLVPDLLMKSVTHYQSGFCFLAFSSCYKLLYLPYLMHNLKSLSMTFVQVTFGLPLGITAFSS